MDAVECGAACLVSILAFHGRHIAIEEARRVCGVSRDGSSALQLTAAASNYGLKCEGYGVDSAELRDLQLPGILYWGFDHFVVLEGWSRGRWRIMDPSIGHRWVSAAEFDEKFTGVVLELSPTADFRRGGRTRGVREALVERMRGSWRVVAATAACGVLLAIPAFTLPALGAVYVDRVLLEGATGWLLPMVLLALAAMVVSAVLAAGFLLPRAGMLFTLPLVIVLTALASSEFRLREALGLAAVLTTGSWLLFVVGLKLRIPVLPTIF
jgi:ABC-type bacteriocin/lantibiotic exporter with double-glycine peptidase domain